MPSLRKKAKPKLIAFDVESNGLDFAHGARPFFVTVCHEQDGELRNAFWEWPVEPVTRTVLLPDGDLRTVLKVLDDADEIVGQNLKFDARAITCLCRDAGISWSFPWHKAQDTLIAGHLLASSMPHDLTSMGLHWLGKRGDIKHLEDALEAAVKHARAVARRDHKDWGIGKKGRADMPSAKDETWRFDYWLPKAVDPDSTVLEEYANADSAVTLLLWRAQEAEIRERDLWAIYRHSMDVARVVPRMESVGVTFSRKRLQQLREENQRARDAAEAACVGIAREFNYDLEVPKASNNGSLRTFCFGAVGPKIISGGQTGVDQAALQAAKDAGLKTGGTMPKGYLTLDGPRPDLKKLYGVKAHRSKEWADRTEANVADADATLQVYRNPRSPGEICTLKAVDRLAKPLLRVDLVAPPSPESVAAWLKGFGTVNVAGNSERTCPGVGEEAHRFLVRAFVGAKTQLLDLPVVKRTETGEPSLDKDAMDVYLSTLEGRQLEFVKNLKTLRKRSTALSYIESWERFGLADGPGVLRMFPSANQTGTDTLRFSMSNPNGQQISKQEDRHGDCEGKGCAGCGGTGVERTSLRHVFGPAPGREWWSLDFENVELRIPAYESGEQKMIELFERPKDPPYFGSYHLLNASIAYPDLFWPLAEKEGAFKERYKDTWYQWIKNFDFALQYGCQEATGDRAAHKKGVYKAIKTGLPRIEALNQECIAKAEKFGWVETMPDKTVDPRRGYPVMTARSEWGRISPTIPLAYHVSSTAMWCTRKSMVRCQAQLDEWRADEGFDGHLALQIHDELVFDFPYGCHLGKAVRLRGLMELSGTDIGVPLKVSMTWNPKTWAKGENPCPETHRR